MVSAVRDNAMTKLWRVACLASPLWAPTSPHSSFNAESDWLSITFCQLLTICNRAYQNRGMSLSTDSHHASSGKPVTPAPVGSAHATIALLQTQSLTTVVQQDIERAILAGEYAPGSKLVEATLAEKMGVSRGPVREAFRMLEEAGLVRTEKNRGVFVRDIAID